MGVMSLHHAHLTSVALDSADLHAKVVARAHAGAYGANDLKMLGAAAVGVAYRAKPLVRQQAMHAINFGGLDAARYLANI